MAATCEGPGTGASQAAFSAVSAILGFALRLKGKSPQLAGLSLEFINPHVQDVSYADHTHESLAFNDWNVTNIAGDHGRGDIGYAVLG